MSTYPRPLRAKITDAVYDHPRADDIVNAVMGAVEAELAGRDSRITELESRLARSQTHRADLTRKNGHLQAPAGAATERGRIRAAIQAEIDDHDPDHTFRDLAASSQTGHGDPGNAGNAWWRAYVHVGGLLHALACVEPGPADVATELTRHDQDHGHYDTTTAPTHTEHTK